MATPSLGGAYEMVPTPLLPSVIIIEGFFLYCFLVIARPLLLQADFFR